MDRRRFLEATAFTAASTALPGFTAEGKSRVIEVHRKGIIDSDNRPDPEGTQEMLDRAMREFTGAKSRKDQWKQFVTADDVVGLKVNGLGGPLLSTKHELVNAVVRGLVDVGVKENNIIVWDNNDNHTKAIGLDFNTSDSGVRVYSTRHESAGHDENETEFGAGSTHLSKILTEQITALINMPIIKDHSIAGTTLALKNISHGITDNPGKHHANGCDPYIAEINAIPVVRKKHRLVVMDGLRGCFEGGPRQRKGDPYNYESILVATDCVAMDTVCTERIEAARKEHGLKTLAQVNLPVKYLATAEKLGLGQRDKSKIEHRIIEA